MLTKILALLAFAAVGGCEGAGLDPILRNTLESPDSALAVSVASSHSAIRAGDSLVVTITATNASTKTIQIDIGCPMWFEVLRDAAVVGPGIFGCPATNLMQVLKSGESYTKVYGWRGTYYPGSGRPFQNLEPGSYSIRGQARLGVRLVRGSAQEIQILP